jgi:hypothetical protein
MRTKQCRKVCESDKTDESDKSEEDNATRMMRA